MTKRKKREFVWLKYGGLCAYCGEHIEFKEMQVDHIRPKSRYYIGKIADIPKNHCDDLDNLNPACRFCNNWKNTNTVEEFRREIEAQVNRARRYSRNFRMAERYGMIRVVKTSIRFHFEKPSYERLFIPPKIPKETL